jgi:hypothetical protein
MKHLAIGIRGWCFEHWVTTFYPDDVPEEWRLPYYSNEFRAVLVPSNYLVNAEPGTLGQWADDTAEDFEFFVELDTTRSWPAWRELLAPLGEQLSGIVIEAKSPAVEWLESARGRAPVFMSHPPSSELGLYAVCNSVEDVLQLPRDGRPLLCCINTDQVLHAKALRVLLESLAGAGDSTGVAVFFGGDKPVLENACQAVLLHQLLD